MVNHFIDLKCRKITAEFLWLCKNIRKIVEKSRRKVCLLDLIPLAYLKALAVSARRAIERAFSSRCLRELEQESRERFAAGAIWSLVWT